MRKATEKNGLARRAMAMLLVVMMVLTNAVSAFAVDGGVLGGDITAGGGDALISEGSPNNPDSDSLESILESIPDNPDNEEASFDGNEPIMNGTSGEVQENSTGNLLQDYINAIFDYYPQTGMPFSLMSASRASGSLSVSAISWSGGDLVFGGGYYVRGNTRDSPYVAQWRGRILCSIWKQSQ